MEPTLEISFGFSRSDGYSAAVEIARSLPGYCSRGRGRNLRHVVTLTGEHAFLATPLLDHVWGWTSTIVRVNGRILGSPEILHLSRFCLYKIGLCYRRFGSECRITGPPQDLCPAQVEPHWDREVCLHRIRAAFGDLCPAQDPDDWADLLVLRAGGTVRDAESR